MSSETGNIPLSERAVLAALHTSVWGAKAADREVTEDVSVRHKAEIKGAGSYSKYLVAPRFFTDINQAVSVGRTTHNLLTLPWSDDGQRVLSNTGYQHHTEQMRLRRQTFEARVDNTCTQEMLDQMIREAETRLGDMFDRDQYPTVEEMKLKFSWDIEISKVPEGGDFRSKLSDAAVKGIVKDIERRSNLRVENAMKDVFTRIYDVTSKMNEKLRAYKPLGEDGVSEGRFRDTLITNAVELAELLPSLNITGDAKIDQLAQQIKLDLGEHSPDVLRGDTKLRNKTADRAEAIAKKVAKYI